MLPKHKLLYLDFIRESPTGVSQIEYSYLEAPKQRTLNWRIPNRESLRGRSQIKNPYLEASQIGSPCLEATQIENLEYLEVPK